MTPTWRHSIRDPVIALPHGLFALVGPDEEAVAFHAEVEGPLEMPQDGDLPLQRLHLRDRRRHEVLVVVRDEREVRAGQQSDLLGPET